MRQAILATLIIGLVVGVVIYLRTIRNASQSQPDAVGIAITNDIVPDGVALYGVVKFSELWDSPNFERIRASAANASDGLMNQLGLPGLIASELDVATFIIHADPELPPVIMARSRKSFNIAAIVKRRNAEALKFEQPISGFSEVVVYDSKWPSTLFAEVDGLLIYVNGTAKKLRSEQWSGLIHRSIDTHRRAEKFCSDFATTIAIALSGSGAVRAMPVPIRGPDKLANYRELLKMETGVVTLSAKEFLKIVVRMKFPNADVAAAAKPQAEALSAVLGKLAATERSNLKGSGSRAANSIEVTQLLSRLLEKLSITADGAYLNAAAETLLPDSIKTALEALGGEVDKSDRQSAVLFRFQEIGQATQRFADRTGRLPNNIYGAGDVPLLSWRVALLPELGFESLYKEFRRQESWDSEHNKKLLAKIPSIYLLPGVTDSAVGHTFVQGFVAPAGGKLRSVFVFGDKEGIPLLIPDGTSNTAFCVEAATAVPWTKPADIEFDQMKLGPRLGGHYGSRAAILLLDGSARFCDLSRLTENALRGLATTNGDERFDLP